MSAKSQATGKPTGIPNFRIDEASGKYVARRPLSEEQIIKAAQRILARRFAVDRPEIPSPWAAFKYLSLHFAGYEREVFACLFLDNQNRPLAFEELFQGTINSAVVYPREVVKRALHHNAAAVILAHNHPSGVAEPSPADVALTSQLRTALALVDVRVIDHLVIGGHRMYSFVEHGLMDSEAKAARNGHRRG
jgi:DNA repair protein RadC